MQTASRSLYLVLLAWALLLGEVVTADPWIQLSGNSEFTKNKRIVFVTGDDEYKSEESMPMMAHILAEQHGFDCTVLFAINRKSGVIDTNQRDNIPGLEALAEADLMVIYTRFRELEDAQCALIEAYLKSGKPIIGIRTSTHAFNFPADKETAYRRYSYNHQGDDMSGGFGKQVLGETWIRHWGRHGTEGTRGIFAPGMEKHPVLSGIKNGEIFGPTDVYEASMPLPDGCQPILLGEVTKSLDPSSAPAPKGKGKVDKNDPMMPVAWSWQRPVGAKGRVFTSTVGGALRGQDDWDSEGMRRMFVNACYWTMGLENQIPEKASVVLPFEPNPYKRGVKPADALTKAKAAQKARAAADNEAEKTILFYGNSMIERLLENGDLEARLQISDPKAGLKIRSLAWTGDEVGNRLRLEKYAQHMKKLIAQWPTRTLVLGYGLNESFAGEAGLKTFRQQYRDHLRQLAQVHPEARFVLLSPIAIENASAEQSANVTAYSQVIAELAEEIDGTFIDLLAVTRDAYSNSNTPLTSNGIHLNEAGNRLVGKAIAEALGASSGLDAEHVAEVAKAASAKQARIAEVVRPKNAVVYFGVRERPQEYNDEMPRYHEMIRLTEALVHDLANHPEKSFAAMTEPSLKPMGPGKGRDDGPKTGIIKTVAENMAEFTVADGYAVNVFASEEDFPELRNPVQIAFDARGRLWVVTMPSFPHTVPGLTPPDKILILEDTNRDGKADKCTPYMEGLDALDGIAFHHTGVVISEQPRLWLTNDSDGDDRSDQQTELLRGIDVTDSHHGGMINPGPMGDIIFSDGVFHRSQLETPFGVHRGIDATTYRLDPLTGRINSEWQHITPNPWDVGFDRWGHPYQMYGDGGVFDGTSLPWTPRGAYQSYGSGKVASDRKGSGMTIVSSPNFPDEWQNGMANASLLGRYAVNLTKMSFDSGMAQAGDHLTVLSSPNAAFRPADLEFGMDGALYVSDFCSPIIGHAQHPMRDPHWDHDFGRIWRIVHTEKPLAKDWPKIEGAPPAKLCELLVHSQDLVREHARIELRKHGAKGLDALDAWIGKAKPTDAAALEAVFVTAGVEEVRPKLIEQLLASEDPLYRGAAVHTLRVQSDLYADVVGLLSKVASDKHPRVQNQLIGAVAHLRRQPGGESAHDLLAGLTPANEHVAKTLSMLDLGTRPIKERSVPVLTIDPKSELTHWLRYDLDGSGPPTEHTSSKVAGGGSSLYRTFLQSDREQPALVALSSLNVEVRLNGTTVFHQVSFWSADQQIPVTLKPGANTLEVLLLGGRRASKSLPKVFLYDAVGNALGGLAPMTDSPSLAEAGAVHQKQLVAEANTLRLQAAAELQFAQKELTIQAGAEATLIFENPDVMLHNVLLLKPGTVDAVGALADKMAADPDAMAKGYIPVSEDILWASKLLAPGESQTLEFKAPEKPGRYPYVCTFPGHWRLMKGELVVTSPEPKKPKKGATSTATPPKKGKVVFESGSSAKAFRNLNPAKGQKAKITANHLTSNDPIGTLSDGKLAQGFGPIFGNGIQDGTYRLDLGESRSISALTAWSHHMGERRGAMNLQLYGSNQPEWNLARATPLASATTQGRKLGAFNALSLRPEGKKTFGEFRYLFLRTFPIAGPHQENTAFQELRVTIAP